MYKVTATAYFELDNGCTVTKQFSITSPNAFEACKMIEEMIESYEDKSHATVCNVDTHISLVPANAEKG